jgi:ribosomal protein RSM22 (predicted rRNA methylase)
MQTEKHSREHSINPALISAIEVILKKQYEISLSDSKKIADCVLTLSDFYINNPGATTPWKEKWCQIAYLAYYLPLNSVRAGSVFLEAKKRGFPSTETWMDFGSGLGSASFAAASLNQGGPAKIKTLMNIESAKEAQSLHQNLIKECTLEVAQNIEWKPLLERAPSGTSGTSGTTGIFSYSLAELKELPTWALDCDNLVIIEPSTQDITRRLMEIREDLIGKNFFAWAPCTHQEACPLLHKSKTDWCHDRIHFDAPEWFLDIENFLPIRNETLTFSYLLMSKKAPLAASASVLGRTTGDLLSEKGKSRQLVCRGPEREFMTWMHRHIDEQEIPRGVLFNWPSDFELKSNEVRVKNLVKLVD